MYIPFVFFRIYIIGIKTFTVFVRIKSNIRLITVTYYIRLYLIIRTMLVMGDYTSLMFMVCTFLSFYKTGLSGIVLLVLMAVAE